jgi:hypothetical protein
VFGVQPGAMRTITSPATYLDGTWHHAIATLSTTGMALYVDGVLRAVDATTTTGAALSGYWRFGCGNLAGWGSSSSYYTGELAYGAVYTSALTATQAREHYLAGTP